MIQVTSWNLIRTSTILKSGINQSTRQYYYYYYYHHTMLITIIINCSLGFINWGHCYNFSEAEINCLKCFGKRWIPVFRRNAKLTWAQTRLHPLKQHLYSELRHPESERHWLLHRVTSVSTVELFTGDSLISFGRGHWPGRGSKLSNRKWHPMRHPILCFCEMKEVSWFSPKSSDHNNGMRSIERILCEMYQKPKSNIIAESSQYFTVIWSRMDQLLPQTEKCT